MIPEITSLIGSLDNLKITIIKNAVDPTKFSPRNLTEENSILYVGRIHPLKQIVNIIRAIALVNKQIPIVKLNIVEKFQSNQYLGFGPVPQCHSGQHCHPRNARTGNPDIPGSANDQTRSA